MTLVSFQNVCMRESCEFLWSNLYTHEQNDDVTETYHHVAFEDWDRELSQYRFMYHDLSCYYILTKECSVIF